MPTAISMPEQPEPRDIVEIVGKHTALALCGPGDLRGTCPFCGSPAFHCRPAYGTYHCYSCGNGGDARAFASTMDFF